MISKDGAAAIAKKQASVKAPGVMPNARTSADYDAGLTHLNVKRTVPRQDCPDKLQCPKAQYLVFKLIPKQDSHKQGIRTGSRLN